MPSGGIWTGMFYTTDKVWEEKHHYENIIIFLMRFLKWPKLTSDSLPKNNQIHF